MKEQMVNIADIIVIKEAIEVASSRGAFRANEMSTIGHAYDKISRWLESVEEQEQTNSEGETDA